MQLDRCFVLIASLFLLILQCEGRRCFNQSILTLTETTSINDPSNIINCTGTEYCVRVEANLIVEGQNGSFVLAKCADKTLCRSLTKCADTEALLGQDIPGLFGTCTEACCQQDDCNLYPVATIKLNNSRISSQNPGGGGAGLTFNFVYLFSAALFSFSSTFLIQSI